MMLFLFNVQLRNKYDDDDIVFGYAMPEGKGRGLALRANLGSDFKRSYLENG